MKYHRRDMCHVLIIRVSSRQRYDASFHLPLECLLNGVFKVTTKTSSNHCIAGHSVDFPHKMPGLASKWSQSIWYHCWDPDWMLKTLQQKPVFTEWGSVVHGMTVSIANKTSYYLETPWELCDRCVIWLPFWQYCCWDACRITKRCSSVSYQSHVIGTLHDPCNKTFCRCLTFMSHEFLLGSQPALLLGTCYNDMRPQASLCIWSCRLWLYNG